jgi:ribosomal protein S18 acetylase RimI-like enzyme
MTSTIAHSIRLRPAQAEDQAFLLDLYRSTRADEMAAWGWDQAQQQAFVALQFRAQQAHYADYPNTDHQIILDDQGLIGRLLLSRLEDEIRLVDIALLPEHRGQGIGRRLIEGLFAEAAGAGKAVRLHVGKDNRAVPLYTRLGFQIIGDKETHFFMEWRPADTTETVRGA